jgi:UDP-glucose 4-epimerase
MRTVLVTGGAGFIGSYVVEELIEHGFKVDVLDTRGRHVPGAVTVLGDVRDAVSTNEAVSRCDGVIHLAGVLGTAEMVANPHPAIEANIHGAVNVFDASVAHGVPVVNIAVGNYWMDNPYSISKDTADRFARVFNTYRGGAITSVRTFDAYGPRQTPAAPFGPSRVRKVVPSFICRALTDQPIEVYGDGSQTIDLIYATDIAKILVAALVVTERDGPQDGIEAGSGVPITVLEIAEAVIEAIGKGSIVHLPMRPGEQPGARIVAQKPLVGGVPLWDGLPPTIDYYEDLLR